MSLSIHLVANEENAEDWVVADNFALWLARRMQPRTLSHVRRLLVKITRKRAVNELKKLTVVPRCWTVPRPGESFAYLLDLTEDSKAWTRNDGRQMSMAAVIKSEVSLSDTHLAAVEA